MAALRQFLRRRRDRLEQGLDRELRYHLDRRIGDLMAAGHDEPEARRQAHLELGGVPQVQEAVRDTWTSRSLDALIRDVRYAMRSLSKSWGFTLGAGAVLALTIAATVAIFSVVDAVLLQPLPYADADCIVSVETRWTNTGHASQAVSGPDFLDWQTNNGVFEVMAAYYNGDTGGTDDSPVIMGDRATFANARYVSAGFFDVFGQTAAAGRLLNASDYAATSVASGAAVARHEWASATFGTPEAAIGQRLTLNGSALEIVGVAPPGFRYPGSTDVWVPLRIDADPRDRGNHDLHAIGKLQAGLDLDRAQARMAAIGDALARQYPENRLKTVDLIPLQERLTGSLRVTLWVLMAAVGAVWLIGCANIANLLLARGASRGREIALRAALGAGRRRVVRQLLTEHGLLAGLAGIAGLLLASVLVRGVVALAPGDLPGIDDVRIDPSAVLFALGLSLASTLIVGIVPALHVSRHRLSDGLKQDGTKTTASRASTRFRAAMVVGEVALSVVLLAAAGLLLRSLLTLQHVNLGFTTDRVLVAFTEYAVGDDPAEITARSRFFTDVLERLRAVPGVHAASGAAYLGMGREPRPPRDFFVEGRPPGQPGQRPQAEMHAITADYFKTREIPLLAGRDFASTDVEGQPQVTIINQAMARLAFSGESPIGRRIRVNPDPRVPWMEIVGIVGDTRWQDPSQTPPPVFYAPSTQRWGNSLSLLARTSLDETALAETLRAILRDANPTVPVKFHTMDELFSATLGFPRFRTQVMVVFGGMAALLAATGLFSVLAYLVAQRTRELAVRRALGASAANVMRLVIGPGLRLVATGLALGLAIALASARLLDGLLFEITPWDVTTYLGTVAMLGAAALLATLFPAIRAATIPPASVLQQE